jgi:hypothetical protein
MTRQELEQIKETIIFALTNSKFKDDNGKLFHKKAMTSLDTLEKQLSICGVVNSKITALVTYYVNEEAPHYMLDDTLNKCSKIVKVNDLKEINEMFSMLIDVKVLK